jgi:hypothetical protein
MCDEQCAPNNARDLTLLAIFVFRPETSDHSSPKITSVPRLFRVRDARAALPQNCSPVKLDSSLSPENSPDVLPIPLKCHMPILLKQRYFLVFRSAQQGSFPDFAVDCADGDIRLPRCRSTNVCLLRIPRSVEGFWRACRSESACSTFTKGSSSGATAPNGSPGTFATRLQGFDVFRPNFGAEAAPLHASPGGAPCSSSQCGELTMLGAGAMISSWRS